MRGRGKERGRKSERNHGQINAESRGIFYGKEGEEGDRERRGRGQGEGAERGEKSATFPSFHRYKHNGNIGCLRYLRGCSNGIRICISILHHKKRGTIGGQNKKTRDRRKEELRELERYKKEKQKKKRRKETRRSKREGNKIEKKRIPCAPDDVCICAAIFNRLIGD
jgi:hypothetical protein